MHIRVAACQIRTYPDVVKSADKIMHWMEEASAEGVDVIAFPEACLCGYPCEAGYWENADPEEFRKCEMRIAEAAGQLHIATVLGTAHWEEGALFNSLLMMDKGGEIRGRYAKTHLAESWPVPGKRLPLFTLAGVKSCFIICHDIRYPELVRLPAIAGAQICYFCSNESGLREEHKLSAYRAMPIARATENGIYCVMANAPGDLDHMRSPSQSHGNSKIIHPDGNILDEAGFFEERLITAGIDLSKATGAMAQRSVNDDTILKEWMRAGVRLVDVA